MRGEKAVVALALKQQRREDRATIVSRPIDVTCCYQPPVFDKSDAEKEFLKTAMKSYFIFEELPDTELTVLIQAMEKIHVAKGTKIVQQDAKGEYFFIVHEGQMDKFCERGNHSVGKVKRGEFFGELNLFYECKGPKSIIADQDTTLWKMAHTTFRHVLAIHAKARDEDIRSTLKKVELFQSLSDQVLTKFADALTRVRFEPNDRIVQKGEVGQIFYIIEEGKVKVHDIGIGDSQSVDQILEAGDWFGERALLTGETRAANITAITEVTTLAMDRETFSKNMGDLNTVLEHKAKMDSLRALPIFANSDLSSQEFSRLADLMQEMCYKKGKMLAEAGKPYLLNVWFIRHGALLVYGGKTGKIYNLKNGDYFGDKSILGDPTHLSTHNATCESNLTTWVLSREDIESVVLDIGRLGQSAGYRKSRQVTSIKLRDLKKHRVLGKGAFGRVWLTEWKGTGTPYALKVIHKRTLLDSHQEKGIIREKELLSLLQHPFILNLVSSFQDNDNLYLLMPLIQGGELFTVVQSRSSVGGKGGGLRNREAAFYAGCIIEALGHFHHRQIAYRDLKLENVMIDAEGYAKIVDLGFAKVVIDKTYTFCGTPEYLAPEIIMAKGHNHVCDYWAFGVLLYELLCGVSPFYVPHSAQMEMFKRIVIVKYDWPLWFSTSYSSTTKEHQAGNDAKDLVSKLLVRNPMERFGSHQRGYLDVRDHPWFVTSECLPKLLLKREYSPPWIPTVKDPFDVSNFDSYDNRADVNVGKPLTAEEQALFEGF